MTSTITPHFRVTLLRDFERAPHYVCGFCHKWSCSITVCGEYFHGFCDKCIGVMDFIDKTIYYMYLDKYEDKYWECYTVRSCSKWHRDHVEDLFSLQKI